MAGITGQLILLTFKLKHECIYLLSTFVFICLTSQMPYNKQDLFKAVDAVRSGQMSVRAASIRFSVPKSTLHDHVAGKVEPGARAGAHTVFPTEVETKMADHIKQAAQMEFQGCSFARKQAR